MCQSSHFMISVLYPYAWGGIKDDAGGAGAWAISS